MPKPAMNEEKSFWKSISTQSEVIRLKSEIEQLRSVCQSEQNSWIQEKIVLRKEIEQLQHDVKNEQEKVLAAKREIKAKEDKFEACNEQLNFARSEFFAEKEIYEKRILDLQKQNHNLKAGETEFIGKIDGLKREHRNELIEKENLIRTLQCDLDMHIKEKEVLLKQLETVYSNLKDVNEVETKLNEALEEKRLLEEKLKKLKESKRLSDIFHDELKELACFRIQNEELREQNEVLRNSALSKDELKEKVAVMETEIQNLKRENEKVEILKRDLDTLRNEIRDWQSVTGVENASAVSEQIARLNETEQRLVKEVEKLQSKCNKDSQLKEDKRVSFVFTEKSSNSDELEKQIQKLEEKCSIISKERDDYRNIIDAREQIRTMNNEAEERNRKRMRFDENSTVHKSLELESLEKQLLEQKEMNTNILTENNSLKSRLQQMENAAATSEVKSSDNEVEKLKQQLMTTEKKQHHILEAFKKTSKEFREVVCMLTGYKIDVLKQKGYRLSHVYAENVTDVLQFELEIEGTMKLLSNGYSNSISHLIDTYVNKCNSFPAFLASLTMELFQRRQQTSTDSSQLSQ